MKNLARRIVDLFIEVAYAEERKIDSHRPVLDHFTEWVDNHFTAITFAEAGEFDTARDFMGGGSGDSRRRVEYCLTGCCAGSA